jgi:ferric-dicitrate binding protein FerR (iron transport regulator)
VADKYFEATLLQGKVNLKRNQQTVELEPGDQVQFDTQNEKIVRKNIATKNSTAWIDGKLIFADEKLGIAIKKLGRWYNVEIILTDPALNDYLLTGTFRDEKLDQTLRMISLALPVKFEFKKENNPSKIQRTIFMRTK